MIRMKAILIQFCKAFKFNSFREIKVSESVQKYKAMNDNSAKVVQLEDKINMIQYETIE